jgi:3-hydroxyisobutyrate dehydrogenase-like beta-hydroxyacid dehydrogenase
LGIGKDRARKYESDLEAGKFLVLVTGTDEDVSQVRDMLQNTALQVTIAT